jgi:hypothetical protein
MEHGKIATATREVTQRKTTAETHETPHGEAVPELHELSYGQARAKESVSKDTQGVTELHHLPDTALMAKNGVLRDGKLIRYHGSRSRIPIILGLSHRRLSGQP